MQCLYFRNQFLKIIIIIIIIISSSSIIITTFIVVYYFGITIVLFIYTVLTL
jgi:hypothetical protein